MNPISGDQGDVPGEFDEFPDEVLLELEQTEERDAGATSSE